MRPPLVRLTATIPELRSDRPYFFQEYGFREDADILGCSGPASVNSHLFTLRSPISDKPTYISFKGKEPVAPFVYRKSLIIRKAILTPIGQRRFLEHMISGSDELFLFQRPVFGDGSFDPATYHAVIVEDFFNLNALTNFHIYPLVADTTSTIIRSCLDIESPVREIYDPKGKVEPIQEPSHPELFEVRPGSFGIAMQNSWGFSDHALPRLGEPDGLLGQTTNAPSADAVADQLRDRIINDFPIPRHLLEGQFLQGPTYDTPQEERQQSSDRVTDAPDQPPRLVIGDGLVNGEVVLVSVDGVPLSG